MESLPILGVGKESMPNKKTFFFASIVVVLFIGLGAWILTRQKDPYTQYYQPWVRLLIEDFSRRHERDLMGADNFSLHFPKGKANEIVYVMVGIGSWIGNHYGDYQFYSFPRDATPHPSRINPLFKETIPHGRIAFFTEDNRTFLRLLHTPAGANAELVDSVATVVDNELMNGEMKEVKKITLPSSETDPEPEMGEGSDSSEGSQPHSVPSSKREALLDQLFPPQYETDLIFCRGQEAGPCTLETDLGGDEAHAPPAPPAMGEVAPGAAD